MLIKNAGKCLFDRTCCLKDCMHVRWCTEDVGSITTEWESLECTTIRWKAHKLLNPTFPGVTRRWLKRNQQDLHRSTARKQRFLPFMFCNPYSSCGGGRKTGTRLQSTSYKLKRNVHPVLKAKKQQQRTKWNHQKLRSLDNFVSSSNSGYNVWIEQWHRTCQATQDPSSSTTTYPPPWGP